MGKIFIEGEQGQIAVSIPDNRKLAEEAARRATAQCGSVHLRVPANERDEILKLIAHGLYR